MNFNPAAIMVVKLQELLVPHKLLHIPPSTLVHDISKYSKDLEHFELRIFLKPTYRIFWQARTISFFKFYRYFDENIASIVLFVMRVDLRSIYVSVYAAGDERYFTRPLSFIFMHFDKFSTYSRIYD